MLIALRTRGVACLKSWSEFHRRTANFTGVPPLILPRRFSSLLPRSRSQPPTHKHVCVISRCLSHHPSHIHTPPAAWIETDSCPAGSRNDFIFYTPVNTPPGLNTNASPSPSQTNLTNVIYGFCCNISKQSSGGRCRFRFREI